MKRNNNLALLLLGIWLVVSGLLSLLTVGGAVLRIIVDGLAVVVGAIILVGWRNWPAKVGMILLAIWLIVSALLSLLSFGFPNSGMILALLAVAAGVAILIEGGSWRSSIGIILMCLWLIATGLLALLNVSFPDSGVILTVLAIVAGVLVLLNR